MSSSFVIEPQGSGSKKDDTLIIVVNDDGTISVDQATLQNLIMNQSDANVSVVRVGQTDGDAANGDLTLTVDPPAPFISPDAAITVPSAATPDAVGLVDPFMEMDPEQLEKLETALQSEQAKQILGENVTAMLDMLTVEEQQKSIKYCIELDHCYTSRTSPSDPEPSDPLPIANSPDIDDNEYKHSVVVHQAAPLLIPSSLTEVADVSNLGERLPTSQTPLARPKVISNRPLLRPIITRGRKITVPTAPQVSTGVTKTVGVVLRNAGIPQSSPNKGTGSARPENEAENDEITSSSESSESEPPSDDDSDFGPRGPRRGGVRARGGRKGLTTRGGSMAATRRRGSNKQMDMDQVRRLDMEMAAAVDAMKSPDKADKSTERFSPVKTKKQAKTNLAAGRKKEDPSPGRGVSAVSPASAPAAAVSESPPPPFEKPLQTTNQVKANLINANMIKGDMILTKPGQARNNQKVLFVQRKVMVRPNELRNPGMKKQSIIVTKGGKTMPLQLQSKLSTSEDGKIIVHGGKTIGQTMQDAQQPLLSPTPISTPGPPTEILNQQQTHPVHSSPVLHQQLQQSQQQQQQQLQEHAVQQPQQQQQHQQQKSQKPAAATLPVKPKTPEVKKERKKSEPDSTPKVEETPKPVEMKTPDASKKLLKKDHRKPPAIIADTLGPALFSTPDIIRRVSSGSEAKPSDSIPGTPTTPLAPAASCSTSGSTSAVSSTQETGLPSSTEAIKSHEETSVVDSKISENEQPTTDMELEHQPAIPEEPSPQSPQLSQLNSEELKEEMRVPTAEELQPSLDPATNTALAESVPEIAEPTEEPVVPNDNPSEPSGIEGEEHLLATLEMEASKHEEELLAEALLLQEELGVDLAEHGGLVAPTASLPENLLSTSTFDTSMDTAEGHISPAKTVEPTKAAEFVADHLSPATPAARVAPVTHVAPIAVAVAHPPETAKKRDEKEPIQIVRGGRVITLPPIEAPATRSKRLQVKAETPQKAPETPKREEKVAKQTIQQHQLQQHMIMQQQHMKEIEEMESEMDDDDDDDDDNSDSEDDPDRLWCICKRPHNNRFMICCDVCEDWFHGKCVHVSKAMGQQMEEKGIEWVCPNCTKKKEQETGVKHTKLDSTPGKALKLELPSRPAPNQPVQISNQRTSMSPSEKAPSKPSSTSDHGMAPVSGVTQCVVCKNEARNSSIYCSDACILMHAQETLEKESKPPAVAHTKSAQVASESPKPAADARVIVFERRTGKVLTGSDAPTTSNFKTWLKENPTFEVVRPNNLNTLQIGGKTVTAIQTQGAGKPANKPAQMTPGVQAKMVYTKVVGSKQTVLAPSNKKLVFLSGNQQRASVSPKTVQTPPQQQQQRQPQPQQQQQRQPQSGAAKSPAMRQTTIKIQPQQVKSPATTPKPTIIKKPDAKTSIQPQQKPVQKTPPAKKTEPEPIRLNVRKTLTELLTTRIKETQDLKLTDEEINELALNIELELYKYFRDTGAKYKAKYRSLVFNIKDTKNLTLFRKIADRSLTPDAVVRLSPDEMASQELAEWREKETKHQLEMIKKNELDLMSQAKSIVVKTHKGEQIIENDAGMDHVDPKTPVQDIVTALNNQETSLDLIDDKDDKTTSLPSSSSHLLTPTIDDSKKSKFLEDRKTKDKEREKDRGLKSKDKEKTKDKKEERSHSRSASHRSKDRERSREKSKDDRRSARNKDSKRDSKSGRERERDRDKDRERDREKNKDRPKDKDRQKKSRSSRGAHKDYNGRDKEKKDEDRKRDGAKKGDATAQPEPEKPIEDRLWRHVEEETTTNTLDGNDSDVSDREPSSTVNIKTPDINEEPERSEREAEPTNSTKQAAKGPWQTVWRGFVNMVDVAKFFITAQEVSGHAKDLMEDLPDTVDVVGRISHDTVWDYISKMKKTGSKEILVIRLTAANDEEKIPYITLYSYLNSRSRLGVVGNVSKNIKDFYIMPFSRQSQIPSVLLPLIGPGFEDQRPHLLLGIIVRNKRKRFSTTPNPTLLPAKITKKEDSSFSSQNVVSASKEKVINVNSESPSQSPTDDQATAAPLSPRTINKELLLESLKDKQKVTQMTLDSLNKAHVGMSRSVIDNATISKIVPELSSKIDILADSPKETNADDAPEAEGAQEEAVKDKEKKVEETDDGDEPYSPGEIDDDNDDTPVIVKSNVIEKLTAGSILSPVKNSTELQRKMDELNRQIEEQKQQIQSISSSFLGDATPTLPGLGLDPDVDMDAAYSPTDARSFTPPPQGITKFAQPILDKVSDITIPPNLQEILANVKRQENSKVDPYLPSKPSATFLTSVNTPSYPKLDKYTPSYIKNSAAPNERHTSSEKQIFDTPPPSTKGTKSTLSSLSELDLIKKAEEELAAVAAVAAATEQATAAVAAAAAAASSSMTITTTTTTMTPPSSVQTPKILVPPPFSSPSATSLAVLATSVFPGLQDSSSDVPYSPSSNLTESGEKSSVSSISEQPKPPGLEDEELPSFPTSPQSRIDGNVTSPQKFVPKSGIVLSVKRKVSEDGSSTSPLKAPRTKSRWGQGPSE